VQNCTQFDRFQQILTIIAGGSITAKPIG